MCVFADYGDPKIAHILNFAYLSALTDDRHFIDDAALDLSACLDIAVGQDNRLADDSFRADNHPRRQHRTFNDRSGADDRSIGNHTVFDHGALLDDYWRAFLTAGMDNPRAIVQVQGRRFAEQIHVRFPERVNGPHVDPVAAIRVGKYFHACLQHARNNIFAKVVVRTSQFRVLG